LVVQKTGWGKSFVYFIATKLLREAGLGPAFADLAIARADAQPDRGGGADGRAGRHDQLRQQDEWHESKPGSGAMRSTSCLISPERLANERFRDPGSGRHRRTNLDCW
jgi:ATP-dependent DNA helicase RecQ